MSIGNAVVLPEMLANSVANTPMKNTYQPIEPKNISRALPKSPRVLTSIPLGRRISAPTIQMARLMMIPTNTANSRSLR
ncbi:hypothetical protein D3C84_963880 [compost metagenome]